MSFKDCILANVEKGILDENEARNLINEYDDLLGKNSEPGAINKLEQQLLDKQIRQKANFLRHMKKRDEFFTRMNSLKTTAQKIEFVSQQLQAARDKGAVTYETTLSVFNNAMKQVNLEKVDEVTFKSAVMAVIDGVDSHDQTVNALAGAMRTMFKYLKNESDTYGLLFGDLGERYFPRFYDKVQFRKIVNDDQWVKETADFFDWGDSSPEQIREALLDFKKDVETEGLHSQSKAENIATRLDKSGGANFAVKRNQSRQLKYKSAQSYIDFNKKFGGGDGALIEHFQKYTMSISNDLGVMKTLGSMPRSLINEAELKLKNEYEAGKGKTGTKAKLSTVKNAASLRSIRSEFEVLMGSAFTGDREGHIYKMFVATQNWMRAAHLGSATISALSDPMFGVIANKLNGGSFWQPVRDYLATFSHLAGHKSIAKEIADELGYLTEGFNGMMIGDTRFTLGGEGAGISKKLADLTFKMSLLDNWTKNGRTIAKVSANNTLATMISKKIQWDQMPDTLRANLQRMAMSAEEWGLISKHLQVREMRGQRLYVQTNELRVSKELGYAKGSDLADKIDAFVEHSKNMSINEGNLRTDAITSGAILSGDGKASGMGKMGSAAFWQYKSFALSIMSNHLIPAMRRASQGIAQRDVRKLDHLALLLIGTTLTAAIPLQLKEIIKGRNPKDMLDAKFWLASALQGGGMGILGDFLFKDTSRAGSSFAVTLAGPYLGTVSDIHGVATGSIADALDPEADDKKLQSAKERRVREAVRVLKKNVPLNNLWYTRLLTDRLLWDNLERVLDPKFDKRQRKLERRLTEDNDGREPFWWAPGRDPSPETIIAQKTARR